MIYNMNDPSLSSAIDDYRTGRYGENYYSRTKCVCPICGEEVNILIYNDYTQEYVGCECCTRERMVGDDE